MIFSFFFFNDTATTEIYTLSLHTLFRSLTEEKIENKTRQVLKVIDKIEKLYQLALKQAVKLENTPKAQKRSEEHTSELQSLAYLVCRLLLEKKNNKNTTT